MICNFYIFRYKSIPSHYSESIRKIVSFMLSTKHEFRPTIEMILHHPSVVINIKEDKKIGSSNQTCLRPKIGNDHSYCKSPDVGFENLTLVDPEQITNKVFKEKWTEKHEALREREAWLRKREKSIGHKERSLANWEKHLQLLLLQAKDKQCMTDNHLLKRKEVS